MMSFPGQLRAISRKMRQPIAPLPCAAVTPEAGAHVMSCEEIEGVFVEPMDLPMDYGTIPMERHIDAVVHGWSTVRRQRFAFMRFLKGAVPSKKATHPAPLAVPRGRGRVLSRSNRCVGALPFFSRSKYLVRLTLIRASQDFFVARLPRRLSTGSKHVFVSSTAVKNSLSYKPNSRFPVCSIRLNGWS